MNMKKYVLLVTIWGMFISFQAAGEETRVSQAGSTAEELLEKYAATADKAFTSFLCKSKTEYFEDDRFVAQDAYRNGKRTQYFLQEIRTDGRRLKRIQQNWGEIFKINETIVIPESGKGFYIDLFDGVKRYEHNHGPDIPGYVIISNALPTEEILGRQIGQTMHGSPCLGYLKGDFKRFDHILKKAKQITVREKMEDIRGVGHYVLEAKTKNGQYTLWFNPEKGYNFSKAVVRKKNGDLYNNAKTRSGDDYIFIMENTNFKEIDGVWVPDKARMDYEYKLRDGGHVKQTEMFEFSSILMNPDHEALGSFLTEDIKNGAIVYMEGVIVGVGGADFTWQDGKVVDKAGKVVMSCYDPNETAAGEDRPSGAELLEKFQETQNKLRSFVIRKEVNIKFQTSDPSVGNGKRTYLMDVRSDGSRFAIRQKMYGNVSGAYEFIPPDTPSYLSTLFDKKYLFQYTKIFNDVGMAVIDKIDLNTAHEKVESGAETGEIARGYVAGDYERVDAILRRGQRLKVFDETEIINGSECTILEGLTNRGKYTLWIDPQHGYNIAKARVLRQKGDLYGTIEHPIESGKITHTLDNVRFELVDGVWVPMEADGTYDRFIPKGPNPQQPWFSKSDVHTKVTEIIINPDHDDLGSFLPDDIVDGAKVHIIQSPNNDHIWKNGKVVDKAGKVVMSCYDPNEAATLKKEAEAYKTANAHELLNKYVKNQEQIYSSFQTKFDIVRKRFDKNIGMRILNGSYEIRFDGTRYYMSRNLWGDCYQPGELIAKDKLITQWLVNKEQYGDYYFIYGHGEKKGEISLYKGIHILGDLRHRTDSDDCWVRGFLGSNTISVQDALTDAEEIFVHDKKEKINGFECFIIEASTKHGAYQVWIDPEHGYNIAKAEVYKDEGDIDYGQVLEKGQIRWYYIEDVVFGNFDGVWVPTEADTGLNWHVHEELVSWTRSHYKRTEIKLSPDFTKDDFALQVPDGWEAKIEGKSSNLIWQDGKVVDKAGKVVMSCYDPNEAATEEDVI